MSCEILSKHRLQQYLFFSYFSQYIIQNLTMRKIEKYFQNSFSDNPDDFNVTLKV